MPDVSLSTAKPLSTRVDALVLGIRNEEDAGAFAADLNAVGFSWKKGALAVLPGGDQTKAHRVIAVGLADTSAPEDLRRAAAKGLKAAKGSATVAFALYPASSEDVGAVAEGALLAAYEYDRYKTTSKDSPKKLTSLTFLTALARRPDAIDALESARIVSVAVNRTRDWVNSPPGDLRPPDFAQQAKDAASATGVKVQVWDEVKLAKEKCGGILGVGQGSEAPPRLVKLTYKPAGAKVHLALVGKGITFDSGGLSIKSGGGMMTMKCDMAGAASVISATLAIAELGLPIAVTTFAAMAENMPSGTATRPGDVLTMRNGKTVEVLNTDAEGRLVLADGLSLAVEAKPDVIVDVATLTGACMVALGSRTSGVFSTSDDLLDTFPRLAKEVGESMWPLPLTEELMEAVTTSTIADIRQHNPKPYGGAIYAASFLRQFVGETDWAHLDIAGPSFNDGGAYDYTPAGGTGASVRTLVQFARSLS
ncbi:MAG: hypothetical protein JWP10_1708 [Nocardioidaceae bacterium]|nr:hypothetical protein [Nocardioidaceae bacterium]